MPAPVNSQIPFATGLIILIIKQPEVIKIKKYKYKTMISAHELLSRNLRLNMGYAPSQVEARTCDYLKRKQIDSCAFPEAPVFKKARMAKKGVRFQARTSTFVYGYVSKLELKQAWLQPSDTENIKQGIRRTVRALAESKGRVQDLDETEHCTRGLESGLSPSVGDLKKQWAKMTLQYVLDEQKLQKQQRTPDQEARLSAISQVCSQKAVRWAAQMAALDAAITLETTK